MADAYGQNYWPFSWAIFGLFLWLVPHISMEIGEYYRALNKSALWSTEELQATGKRAIRQATHIANLIAIILIVAAACAIALNTKNLDARMHSIIFGLSYMMGAVVIFAVSWKFPEWLEVYHIREKREVLPVTRSIRALKFNVMWSILAQYFEVYFFLLPFYCGQAPAVIPVSAIVGIFGGAAIDFCVYFGRTRVGDRRAFLIVFAMIFVAVAFSSVLFGGGCTYINDVWGAPEDDGQSLSVFLGCLFAWLVVGLAAHSFFCWLTTKKTTEIEKESVTPIQPEKSFKYKNVLGEAIVEKGPAQIDNVTKKTKAQISIAKKKAKKEIDGATQMGKKTVQSITGSATSPKVKFEDDDGEDEEIPVTAPNQDVSQDKGSTEDEDEVQEEMEQQLESTYESNLSNEDDQIEENEVEEPTYWSLLKPKCCCCCCWCGGPPAQCCDSCAGKNRMQKVYWSCWWTLWAVLSFFSLCFIIVNIGATYQQDVVRYKLPSVKKILYENMNDIEVCAYDGDGSTGSLSEMSTIKTFPSKDAAHNAGYLILHCGPCAACSTWPNIKYEFTTRHFLAEESARCGRKSLGGGADAVQSCLESPPIEWHGECAVCWTVDILCSKKYCAFNFLQSIMINTMTNFQVGPDSITAATCEEANCEAFPYPENFVECSGATRRRMNVTSTIARPADEECQIVDVSWETLFPGE